MVKAEESAGNIMRYTYDSYDMVTGVTEPLDGVTLYKPDADGIS